MAHDDFSNGRLSVPGASEAVGDLAKRVLSVLNARQSIIEHDHNPYVRDALYDRVTSTASFAAENVLNELLAHSIDADHIIDCYIPECAEQIGVDWVADDMNFAEVTIASLRLQSLLNEAAHQGQVAKDCANHPFTALIVMTEDNQHTLGGFVVAAQLRRQGICVEVMCAEPADIIIENILLDDFDVILFSCSSVAGLASVSEIALRVRNSEIRIPTLALGGLIVKQTSVAATDYNVDVVTNDISKIISRFDRTLGRPPAASG